MNIKKILSAVLATSVLSVSLMACGNATDAPEFPSVAQPSDFTVPLESEDDGSELTTEASTTISETTVESSLTGDVSETTTETLPADSSETGQTIDLGDLDDLDDLDGSDGADGVDGVEGPALTATMGVDKGLLNVKITFPASMMSDEELDLDEYIRENDFSAAAFNDDGSLTVTMSRARHEELLGNLRDAIEESLDEMVSDEGPAHVKSYEIKDNYSNIRIMVDAAAYAEAFDMSLFTMSLLVSFYQTYDGAAIEYNISIVDEATGEVLDAAIQPDAGE